MSSKFTFAGVHAKLDRADALFAELQADAQDLLAAFDSAVVRDRVENGEHVFVLRGAPPVPAAWGPLIGDIVHNMRSGLDHLAWQLVVASGNLPSRRRPATSFPIRWDTPVSGREPTIEPGIAPPLQTLLIDEQPYVRFAEAGGLNPRKCPLALIAELNNLDKHVDLIPVVTVPEWSSWSVPPETQVQVNSRRGSLIDGDEVGRIRAVPHVADDHDFELSVSFSLRAQPSEGYPELGSGDLVSWALAGATTYVRSIVHRFETAVAKLP